MRQTHDSYRGGVVRLGPLDGLRGLAVLAIVFGYQAQALFTAGSLDGAGFLVDWFRERGWAFVDLFFVISGFIFAHVYVGGRGLSGSDDVASFTVGRLARLYPLHLLTLVMCAALYWGEPRNTLAALVAHLFMLQGVVQPAAQSFNASAWLLSVEAICCLFFGLALHAGRRTLVKFTIAAILVSTIYLVVLGQPGGPWSQDLLMRGLLGFYVGQALWRWRVRLRRIPALVFVIPAILSLAIDMGPWSPILPLSLLAWPALLLLSLRIPLLEGRTMIWLGDRSYAIFLVHLPVLDLILRVTGPFDGSAPSVAEAMLLYAGAVLLVAELAYRIADLPTRRLIRSGGLDMRDVGLTRALPGRG
jgi:peptidoglycan/LPS O-acetylase OafA/YrhL